MNTTKILTFLALSIFLVSTANALIVIDAQWENGATTLEIEKGEVAVFDVYFVTYDYPMNVEVALYDSNNRLIHVFIDSETEDYFFEHAYTISKAIIGEELSVGTYKVKISGSDADNDSDTISLTLKVISPSGDDNNGQDDDDEDKDDDKKSSSSKERYYEDDFDRQKYLDQFQPKTINLDEDTEQTDDSSKSWVIWIIVGLIILVILIMILISLGR
ncbi:MAG: hypothetical protein Q8P15_01835 [Nanoarchaeota archaeon]|nr:hypothetical protein [Nanoarchaeota archaeon]